jgi:hypothetical protein
MPEMRYLESLVNTASKVFPFAVRPLNASITERSAMRLFVVPGSEIQ